MRIACFSLDEFLQNLDEGQVHRGAVHVGRVLNQEGITTTVVMQCSAVVVYSDDSEVLVEAGIYCGKDVDAGDGGSEGSERCDDLHAELVQYAETKGYRVLPGIIDM